MKKDWTKFYKEAKIAKTPTPFAKFVVKFFDPHKININTILDLGSGNGRDTYYLAENLPSTVIGIDPAALPEDNKIFDASFVQDDWKNSEDMINYAEMVYSRFFLHSIHRLDLEKILMATNGYFVAEARSTGDKPEVYPEHDREFVCGTRLLRKLIHYGYEILYFEKARGLAKYKGEDPLVIRIIARKAK